MINIYNEKNFTLNKEEQTISLNEKNEVNFLMEKKYKFSDTISSLFEKENALNKIDKDLETSRKEEKEIISKLMLFYKELL